MVLVHEVAWTSMDNVRLQNANLSGSGAKNDCALPVVSLPTAM